MQDLCLECLKHHSYFWWLRLLHTNVYSLFSAAFSSHVSSLHSKSISLSCGFTMYHSFVFIICSLILKQEHLKRLVTCWVWGFFGGSFWKYSNKGFINFYWLDQCGLCTVSCACCFIWWGKTDILRTMMSSMCLYVMALGLNMLTETTLFSRSYLGLL